MSRSLRHASRRLLGAAVALTLMSTMAACSTPSDTETPEVTETLPGGVLTTMALGPVQTWDPQRIASRSDAAFASRVFSRSLTAYQHGPEPDAQLTLTGDLAADIGSPDESLKVWSFSLREGVKWQDGSLVTCEDVKYGISRSFATEEVTGGPNYAVAYLDIPKTPKGASIYLGPYAEGKAAEAGLKAFDKAVTCDEQELVIRLSEPVADFPGMVSTLGFAAYKESADKGAGSTYTVFSAGPYTLSGAWTPDRGGTFVRNPHWSAANDPIRLALPDRIIHREGVEPQEIAQRIIADEGDATFSVALDTTPPAMQQQIADAKQLRDRSVNALNGLVDYLVPNFESEVMSNAEIRAALALSTDRDAYVAALGGATAAEPTGSILSQAVRSALPNPDEPVATASPEPEAEESDTGKSDTEESGTASDAATTDDAATAATDPTGSSTAVSDRDRAKELLTAGAKEAKVTLPVPVRVAYRSSPTMDAAMEALAAGWTQAGFEVELQPVIEGYFTEISEAERADETDVFWSNWAADWNSASTVLPPLFDSRLNISKAGSGRNYGYFVDKNVDAAMTAAMAIADNRDRDQAWFDIDTTLRSRGAYVPLAERKSMYVSGSAVGNLITHPALGGTVDLALIGVEQ